MLVFFQATHLAPHFFNNFPKQARNDFRINRRNIKPLASTNIGVLIKRAHKVQDSMDAYLSVAVFLVASTQWHQTQISG